MLFVSNSSDFSDVICAVCNMLVVDETESMCDSVSYLFSVQG